MQQIVRCNFLEKLAPISGWFDLLIVAKPESQLTSNWHFRTLHEAVIKSGRLCTGSLQIKISPSAVEVEVAKLGQLMHGEVLLSLSLT
jgi:hypothetical protein